MKAATLFIQVALVAAGIFVYDQLRSEGPRAAPEGFEVRAEAPASSRPGGDTLPPIVLEGTGGEVLRQRVGAIEDRLAALERAVSAGPREPGGADEGWDDPAMERPDSVGGGGRPSAEDLRWFRAVKDEVERLERRERYETMIVRQLERLGVDLTPDQQNGVVRTTIDFRDRVRDTVQAQQTLGTPIEERQRALDALRVEFDRTIYSIAPSSEAEKIVDVLGRYPGFGFKREVPPDGPGGGPR